ncbi:MAG TPA: four helix bundle protein [Patescibacteria group bacterium]|nr:four helix bundle protein [Patescibacteria group bacterium]
MSPLPLNQLKIYQLNREYSRGGWQIYERLTWEIIKTMGDQMIRSIDSVGANIAEGYGRYHYLDKIKFYYNARGSLFESKYWLDLKYERKIIESGCYLALMNLYQNIVKGLNGLISSNYRTKFSS